MTESESIMKAQLIQKIQESTQRDGKQNYDFDFSLMDFREAGVQLIARLGIERTILNQLEADSKRKEAFETLFDWFMHAFHGTNSINGKRFKSLVTDHVVYEKNERLDEKKGRGLLGGPRPRENEKPPIGL